MPSPKRFIYVQKQMTFVIFVMEPSLFFVKISAPAVQMFERDAYLLALIMKQK